MFYVFYFNMEINYCYFLENFEKNENLINEEANQIYYINFENIIMIKIMCNL